MGTPPDFGEKTTHPSYGMIYFGKAQAPRLLELVTWTTCVDTLRNGGC